MRDAAARARAEQHVKAGKLTKEEAKARAEQAERARRQQQAEQAMELGFKFGIGGPITYERAKKMRALIAGLPRETLLLQTDAPDQPDAQHHNQRNEPAYLVNVLECLSELRNEPAEDIARETTRNAKQLFNI